MEEIKKERGITLIALVITIIVLLILAGISIVTITGNNSVIEQADNAKNLTEVAKEKELIEISSVRAMGNNRYGNLNETELQNILDIKIL